MLENLCGYILPIIIFENENGNINKDPFPIEIYSRYKSPKSTTDKVQDWSKRKEKKNAEISDYFAIRIVPSKEHSTFMAHGDAKLQELMDQREKVRRFIAKTSKSLSESPDMTFRQYCNKCNAALEKLKEIVPKDIEGQEATKLIEFYDGLEEYIESCYDEYKNEYEDASETNNYEYYSELLKNIDLESLLYELRDKNANEVVLYKLKKDMTNVFEQSEWLKSYRHIY